MQGLPRNLFLSLFLLIRATDPLEYVIHSLARCSLEIAIVILLDLSNPVGQVLDVAISTLRTQTIQSNFQAQEVIYIWPTRAHTLIYMLCQLLGVLRPYKLVVLRRSNVHQRPDGWRAISRMERGVLDRVAIDFAYVEILTDLVDLRRFNSICRTPDFI